MTSPQRGELAYIKCVHDERRGLLISNPPQCLCSYCDNTWIYEPPRADKWEGFRDGVMASEAKLRQAAAERFGQ